uniref:Uncharacterized protein n=1 Tax=Arion vulgaris TaxID=1028688 RepID=A0A0B6YXZ4_9EUPU
MHDSLRIEMKREYENHMQTRAKLQEVLSKLDTSLTRITVLTKQMEDDKRTFHSVCESLRQKTEEIQARNRDLESRLTEKSLLCERQQSQVSQQSQEIAGLLEKQQTQSRKYQHMMMEADVEKQQEVYLSQIFSGRNKKKV